MNRRPVLPETWNCPQIFRDRLGSDAGHQRTMVHDGHLLLILHAPPRSGEIQRQGRLFWRQPNGDWMSTEKGGLSALKLHLQEFQEILLELEKREEVAEGSADYFPLLEDLAPLQRTLTHLHNSLQEARKAISSDKDLINLRDQSYQLVRSVELCQTSAKNGLEYTMAKKTEEQAAAAHQMALAAHRLNLLAGFFFPLVTIATIFSMPLIPIPAEHSHTLFYLIMGIGLVSGILLTAFVSTRKPKRD